MIELVRKVIALLDRKTRIRIVIALLISVVLAGLESLAIGTILPFIELIGDPERIRTGTPVRPLYELLGVDDPTTFVNMLGLALLLVFLLRTALSVWYTHWQLGFLMRNEAASAARLLDRYLNAAYQMHLDRSPAELLRTAQTSVTMVFSGAAMSLLTIMSEAVVVLAILVILVLADPFAALAAALLLGIVTVAYYAAVNRWATRVGADNQRYVLEVYKSLRESLDGVKEAKALGREKHFVDSFARTRSGWADVRRDMSFLNLLPRYYLETALIVTVLAIGLVVLQGNSGPRAIAVLGLFVAAGFRLLPSVNRLLTSTSQLRLARDPVNDVFADFTALAPFPVATEDEGVLDFRDQLEVTGVSFRYPSRPAPVLDDVSIVIRRGESIGLVGPSGSGKTTLADIVLGLLAPTSGEVRVDGRALAPTSGRSGWRRFVGYVPQAVYLSDDSLRHNVAFGLPEAEIEDESVWAALDAAQLSQFARSLPDGLDTRVGERGVQMSGGQRQRIGIARALYHDPELLILDEATSSLDTETEARVSDTLRALHGRKTLLVIAHRLSTIRSCDRLYLLQAGRVAASGSYAALERDNAAFARLVSQSDGTDSGSVPVGEAAHG